MKRIIISADDYGKNLAISDGIRQLADFNRISAIGCMVETPYWRDTAAALKPYINKVDIGLHFDLTEGLKQNLAILIIKTNLHLLARETIIQELERQLSLFAKALGKEPDFIDGHQHIHQLPVICDAIIDVYRKRFTNHKPYLRLVNPKLQHPDISKKIAIRLISDFKFRQKITKAHIPHNKSFAGIYNFANKFSYAKLFPEFLSEITDAGLIMCHPGLPSSDSNDPITENRYQEFKYLSSGKFLQDCKDAGIEIRKNNQVMI